MQMNKSSNSNRWCWETDWKKFYRRQRLKSLKTQSWSRITLHVVISVILTNNTNKLFVARVFLSFRSAESYHILFRLFKLQTPVTQLAPRVDLDWKDIVVVLGELSSSHKNKDYRKQKWRKGRSSCRTNFSFLLFLLLCYGIRWDALLSVGGFFSNRGNIGRTLTR